MHQPAQRKRSVRGGWLFLMVMLLVYGAIALLDPSLAARSLSFFTRVLIQILPVLALVFILFVLFNLMLTPERIRNYVGKTSGLKGWLLAMAGGIFSTGPIYPWYILLGELKQQGMKPSLAAVFLYSRAIKLPLFPFLVHYFGVQYTLILSLYLIFFSLLSGVITGFFAGEDDVAG
jgi:uncharacterized membrane protein YraQ (UPF0718 family)